MNNEDYNKMNKKDKAIYAKKYVFDILKKYLDPIVIDVIKEDWESENEILLLELNDYIKNALKNFRKNRSTKHLESFKIITFFRNHTI